MRGVRAGEAKLCGRDRSHLLSLGLWAARFPPPPVRVFLICADVLAGFSVKSVQKVRPGSSFLSFFSGVHNMLEVIVVIIWRGFKEPRQCLKSFLSLFARGFKAFYYV